MEYINMKYFKHTAFKFIRAEQLELDENILLYMSYTVSNR